MILSVALRKGHRSSSISPHLYLHSVLLYSLQICVFIIPSIYLPRVASSVVAAVASLPLRATLSTHQMSRLSLSGNRNCWDFKPPAVCSKPGIDGYMSNMLNGVNVLTVLLFVSSFLKFHPNNLVVDQWTSCGVVRWSIAGGWSGRVLMCQHLLFSLTSAGTFAAKISIAQTVSSRVKVLL